MKKDIILYFFLLMGTWSTAQSLTPEIVSAGRSQFKGDSFQLSWTIGEPIIHTYISNTNQLTQGFHQTNLVISDVPPFHKKVEVKVFPNPTLDVIQIVWKEDINSLELMNNTGHILLKKEVKNIFNHSLDLSDFPSGVYWLFFKIKNNPNIKYYKIVKMQ